MSDTIFEDFLDNTTRETESFLAPSDVARFVRLPLPGVGLFIVTYDIPYLAQDPSGGIRVAPGPLHAAIRFGPSYLQHVSPLEIVQVKEKDLFHSNFSWPVLCAGAVRPGMSLPLVIRHVYEILSYANYATDDGLNPFACARLREEPGLLRLLPPRPRLVRRRLELETRS